MLMLYNAAALCREFEFDIWCEARQQRTWLCEVVNKVADSSNELFDHFCCLETGWSKFVNLDSSTVLKGLFLCLLVLFCCWGHILHIPLHKPGDKPRHYLPCWGQQCQLAFQILLLEAAPLQQKVSGHFIATTQPTTSGSTMGNCCENASMPATYLCARAVCPWTCHTHLKSPADPSFERLVQSAKYM